MGYSSGREFSPCLFLYLILERRKCCMAKHVSADQVEVARNVDLIDYLERKGEPLKKEGRY